MFQDHGLRILVLWAGLCALWNVYGAIQINAGGLALGPTATFAGAGLSVVFAVLFVATSARWPIVYKVLAAIAAVLGALTIRGAFIQDPAPWPSDFWRWAGVAVNTLALFGAALAFGSSRTRVAPPS